MDTREESYPKTNDVWGNEATHMYYVVHSLSPDGWTRYVYSEFGHEIPKGYPMYTMPTDEFMKRYKRINWIGTADSNEHHS